MPKDDAPRQFIHHHHHDRDVRSVKATGTPSVPHSSFLSPAQRGQVSRDVGSSGLDHHFQLPHSASFGEHRQTAAAVGNRQYDEMEIDPWEISLPPSPAEAVRSVRSPFSLSSKTCAYQSHHDELSSSSSAAAGAATPSEALMRTTYCIWHIHLHAESENVNRFRRVSVSAALPCRDEV